jgi:chemotaxis regulatin CheY-phosphate phosphatase CheZ
MSEESLRSLVADLRAELARARGLDADAREGLHGLAREVEAALERAPAGSDAEAPALRDRLADRVRELEASHPTLSRIVGNIVDTLAFYNI